MLLDATSDDHVTDLQDSNTCLCGDVKNNVQWNDMDFCNVYFFGVQVPKYSH